MSNTKTIRHMISTDAFANRTALASLFRRAAAFERADKHDKLTQPLKGKVLATVFYEPSTRTRFSFEAAMLKLGGQVITTESAGHFSSAIKGESLEDTVRIVAGYADAIVLRHPEIGAARRAAAVSPVPVLNAGDGAGEHPTQALLDLYTIDRELGRLRNFTIVMVGDLKHGRTIHSLIQLLAACSGVRVLLVSPPELQIPGENLAFLKRHRIETRLLGKLQDALPDVDILYMTRIQKERFRSPRLYERLKHAFILQKKDLGALKESAVIMHPLPRAGEIDPGVDSDPRAAYFRQAQNGLYVRMAVLAELFCPMH